MSNRVLIVDDEKQVLDLFTKLLEKEKYAVKTAVSGEEALEMINKEDFDIVLLDIKMPGMGGIEALKRMKQAKQNLIVILITALGYDESLIKQCMELGCSGYIGKNVPISQIISNFKLFVAKAKEKQNK